MAESNRAVVRTTERTLIQIPPATTALIFDMDGTLVNSEPVGPETFTQIANKYGITPTETEKAAFLQSWKRIGDYKKEDELMAEFCILHQLPIAPDNFINEFFSTYLDNLTNAKALKGVDVFLNTAKQKGLKLAVVSASKTAQIKTVLENHGWEELFDLVVGEEDITKHKPDPEGYIKAITLLHESPNKCIVFEDAKNGVLAGKASGSYVIGLREGNAEIIDLSAADTVVDSFADVIV